ncbi:hypothetical protein MKW98_002697 [Papaver atlanticum]|uniref:Uncharacterized protein n=1 Tax=Papaver atlanticum TaxID=357466 RepID=A0AAD4XC94_9MAGN|nr:hypothetical protein MKW98_002697 [Papaver atlanticum]
MGENLEKEERFKLLEAELESYGKNPLPSTNSCIYRVPKKLRRVKEEAYIPEIISIGPYHQGNPILSSMEDNKKWYFQAFVSRKLSPSSELNLKDLIKAIEKIETVVREYYFEKLDERFTSDEFVKMMLIDGCFILELLHRAGDESGRNDNDPIFNTAWMLFSLQHDLILLENQIPFLVLQTIFSLTCRDIEQGERTLMELVVRFFAAMLPTIQVVQQTRSNYVLTKPKHILDLLRNILLPSASQMEVAGRYPVWEFTHCVTDLWEAGVDFKRKEKADGLLDIQFNGKEGIFEIPPFFFDESTDVLLRNLIAMEQSEGNSTRQITSYVLLLDILMNSEKDVKLLRHKKIIHSYLGDDEEMAVVINSLCKGVSITKFYYDGLCHRCNEYFERDWHKWRAVLKRDYFNTPWAVLSFTGAVLLLFLTLIQTILAILSYASPKKAS